MHFRATEREPHHQMQFSVISKTPNRGTLTGTTTPGQSGHGGNGNEEMAPQFPKL